MYQYGVFFRPDLVPFIILETMKITVLSGASEFTLTTIVKYRILCIAAWGDVDMGYRFGQLGLSILYRDGPLEILPSVHDAFYGSIHILKHPITESRQQLARAYRIGLHTGDFQGAFSVRISFVFSGLMQVSGSPRLGLNWTISSKE
jgi:hypothetical protein